MATPLTILATPPVATAMLMASLKGDHGHGFQQVVVTLSPGLPRDSVAAAWAQTVEKTAVMRRGFLFRDGVPCGMVPLEVEQALRIEPTPKQDSQKWLEADRDTPLPLDGGLPWRAVFWPESHEFVWTFHHALLDGRSIATILKSFQDGLVGRTPDDLDLKEWHEPDEDMIARAGEMYRASFSQVDDCRLEFPDDCGTGPSSVNVRLGKKIAKDLESVAESMDVTAATLLTWSWGQAVARAAGVSATAVGQVRSGEPQPGRVGFSMNTLPLVIQRADEGALKPVLQSFRDELLALRSIERVSPHDLPASIFDESGGPWPGGIVMVERGGLEHQVGLAGPFESIRMLESSGEALLATARLHPELELEVEVDGRSLGSHAAQCLLDLWAAMVASLANSTSGDLEEVAVLPKKMRDNLEQWESGGAEASCLHLSRVWRKSVDRFASSPAILTADATSISYADLNERAEHLAARLEDEGVQHGSVVASLVIDRAHGPEVMLAIARLGAIHVPLDPDLPNQRRHDILENSQPCLILSDEPSRCDGFSLKCIAVDGNKGRSPEAEVPESASDPLSILYTSGSTGEPKGVVMVHGGVVNEGLSMASLGEIGPGDRLLQFASPGFDASLEEILATLLSGATLVPRPDAARTDLLELHKFITTAGITVLDLSTAHWCAWCAWMISEKETVPANVKTTIIGGERASAAALEDWFRAGGRDHLLINTYGPTEASIVGTAELIRDDWSEPGDPAIGRPLQGVHARVADASGAPLPPGAAGELWLGGICIGPGYWRRDDLTEMVFRSKDGKPWYRTGDRVHWSADGRLRFLGREDDQLKIRGNRVEPREVTRVLEEFPGVSSAHAGPIRRPDGTLVLAAWIRWEESPGDNWPSRLTAHAALSLPTAAVPTRWCEVDQFELTERGKLDRQKLPEPLLTASTQGSSDPPATATEKRLAVLWSDLLNISPIGRDESFFELGGDSIAALKLFAGIARDFGVRVPMASLMQAPTLRLLAEVVDRASGGEEVGSPGLPVVVPVRSEGDEPSLFCIHGGDGGVIFYRSLGESLPPGRPLLAIESPALSAEGDHVLPVPVEELAASYIAILREHQPQGPYHLLGYSYGGLLVYEMACQLTAAGERVRFTGMVDTVNPKASERKYRILERVEVYWKSSSSSGLILKFADLIKRARNGVITHFNARRDRRVAQATGKSSPYSDVRSLQVREANVESGLSYHPRLLDDHVYLFKSKVEHDKYEFPDDYGWGDLTTSLEVVDVPGRHLAIFEEENVGVLAEKIWERL